MLNKNLYIRIYDDNCEFDPRKEMKEIELKPENPVEEKIVIRLVKK